MRVCARCKQIINDGETFCSRCGSTQFIDQSQVQQRTQQNMQGPRPMNNQQRPMVNNQQRPRNGQQMMNQQQFINNGQQNMHGQRPMNNQQRPMNNQQRPQQNMNGQININNQQMMNNQYNQQGMNMGNQTNFNADFTDNFSNTNIQNQNNMNNGKKQKQPKVPKQQIPDDGVTVSVKEWIITQLILCIPLFNIVYILMQIKKPNIKSSKKNYLIAFAIYFIAAVIISVALTAVIKMI